MNSHRSSLDVDPTKKPSISGGYIFEQNRSRYQSRINSRDISPQIGS